MNDVGLALSGDVEMLACSFPGESFTSGLALSPSGSCPDLLTTFERTGTQHHLLSYRSVASAVSTTILESNQSHLYILVIIYLFPLDQFHLGFHL